MNNNVKERPILFSADMIRALLQEYSMPGQYKNQTRRTRGLNRFNDFPEHLKERGWEFWYEGKRREDLIRMGKYVETGKKYSTNFSEKNLLFPIPTSVIIENSHIEQNPHY